MSGDSRGSLSNNATEKSPTADVYAGDTDSTTAHDETDGAMCFFDIEADSEPGTFARIAGVLNIANVAPSRVTLDVEKDETLKIHIELRVGFKMAQSIQRKLGQLTDVLHVHTGMVPSN